VTNITLCEDVQAFVLFLKFLYLTMISFSLLRNYITTSYCARHFSSPT